MVKEGRKMKKMRWTYLALMLLVAVSAGCRRIELYERTTSVRLAMDFNISIDYDIDMSVETDFTDEYLYKINGKHPEYVEILFYDKETNNLVTSSILPPEGGYVSVPTGEYNLVIYNFGTESTQIDNIQNRLLAEAYTSDITKEMRSRLNAVKNHTNSITKVDSRAYEDDPIIYEPDHLYVAREDVSVPSFLDKTSECRITATAETIVEVYSMEVLGVTGAENIERVDAFITGQIRSKYFATEDINEAPATLYITMSPDPVNNRLYTVFGTFGKLTGEENHVYLDITVTDSGGGQYRYIYDVTDQFDDTANDNKKIHIDGSQIDIPEALHGGGGIDPSVGEWEEETIEVPLG